MVAFPLRDSAHCDAFIATRQPSFDQFCVLFIDHISKLKRDRVIKKSQKAAKRSGEGSHVL